MPVIGWSIGRWLSESLSGFGHWAAFLILGAIGVKMIYESFKEKGEASSNPFGTGFLIILALAVSIDALAAGFSLAVVNKPIVIPSVTIGFVTFLMSYLGLYMGKEFGVMLGRRMEFIGGLILIMVGLRILLEHLI